MAASSSGSRASSPAACSSCGIGSCRSVGGALMLLEAKNVSKAFGSFLAVSGADLAVAEGEIIGLIGPNGAGKSTFFNCLAGETAPTTGRIVFDGKDVTHAAADVRARAGIGRTFQVPITFEDMTVLENVMVGAFLRHPHRSDARVLATEPRLLLLDESLAGLTPTELQAAIALVRRIHGMGITIVIVEHIMEVIMTLTKRVLVFNQGHVIASGTPEAVVRQDAVIEAYLGRAHRRQQDQKSV